MIKGNTNIWLRWEIGVRNGNRTRHHCYYDFNIIAVFSPDCYGHLKLGWIEGAAPSWSASQAKILPLYEYHHENVAPRVTLNTSIHRRSGKLIFTFERLNDCLLIFRPITTAKVTFYIHRFTPFSDSIVTYPKLFSYANHRKSFNHFGQLFFRYTTYFSS